MGEQKRRDCVILNGAKRSEESQIRFFVEAKASTQNDGEFLPDSYDRTIDLSLYSPQRIVKLMLDMAVCFD